MAKEKSEKSATGSIIVEILLRAKGNGMLQNPMSDETLEELIGTKTKKAVVKDRPLKEIAHSRVLRENGETGKPGIKLEYITACLVTAGRNVKIGKKQISTAETTTVFAFLDFKGATFFPFEPVDKTKFTKEDLEKLHPEGWIMDMRRGVLNGVGKKSAVGIVRPLFKHWQIKLRVEINQSAVDGADESIVKQLFESAGTMVGLGDFRPSKRGPFGMFEIADWQVVKSA